jgi:hypothetical protein
MHSTVVMLRSELARVSKHAGRSEFTARIGIDFLVNFLDVTPKKMKPAAGDIAAGSAILRKAGRFLPETPEGSDVCASVSLTGGRKRQKLGPVNAPHERRRQNHAKKCTMIRDFCRIRQK